MRGFAEPALPTGAQLVLTDVFGHPASSITEITRRTGLRQSHVSTAVAQLRDRGILETHADPADGRRTQVSVSGEHPHRVVRAGATPVDGALAEALRESDPRAVAEVVAGLEALAARLEPAAPGPILRTLREARLTT